MMKFPNMIRPWDSRFTDFVGKRQFKAFRIAYLAKVRPYLEAKLIHLQESKDKTISAVTENQRLYAKTSEDVLENGTSDEKFALVKTLYAKLAESEAEKMAAKVLLESHQSEMEEKLSGRKDPETLEWIRNIEGITKSNEASKTAFIGELEEQFDTQKDNWWDEVRRGSNRKSKWLAMSICKLFAYYDLFFSESDLSLIFGVK